MSIRQIQINRTIKNIIKKYLLGGKYPTLETITYHYSQWLREHIPGTPTFKPFKEIKKGKSSAERYNTNIRAIHQDLSDSYEAIIKQTNRMMGYFEYSQVEKEKIRHMLNKISKEIDRLILLQENTSGYVESQFILFDDLSLINQERTTAFIDLKNRQVTLEENRRETRKIDLSQASIQFNMITPATTHVALESTRNALDDNINTAWWHVVKTQVPGEIKAEAILWLTNTETITEIEYTAHHFKPVDITLEYTLDGVSFHPLPEDNGKRKVSDHAVWQFPAIQAKGIKFIFEKKGHDERSGGYYQYYFGAKNISLYRKSYVSEGVLYTEPLTFNIKQINECSLFVKDHQPQGSAIDYEIALYDPEKDYHEQIWYPISSADQSIPKYPKVISFNGLSRKYVEFSKSEETGEIKNGMRVFRLVRTSGEPVIEHDFNQIHQAYLLRGINQWKRERTYVPFEGKVPLNSHWDELYETKRDMIQIEYFPISNELNLRRGVVGIMDNFYRFTTCVYSERSMTVPLSISVIKTLQSGKRIRLGTFSVYVNQKRMSPSMDEVTMELKQGWNEIQILFHWGDMQNMKDFERLDLPNETYLGKFNFSIQSKIRADLNPMQMVDVHTLFHNLPANTRDYFSIYERQVVLNHMAKDCLFQLVYDVEDQDVTRNRLLLRAYIKGSDINRSSTPKINQIEVRVK